MIYLGIDGVSTIVSVFVAKSKSGKATRQQKLARERIFYGKCAGEGWVRAGSSP